MATSDQYFIAGKYITRSGPRYNVTSKPIITKINKAEGRKFDFFEEMLLFLCAYYYSS